VTGKLHLESFKTAFSTIFGQEFSKEQLEVMFKKVDVDNDAEISWDDFSSYILLRSESQRQIREEGSIHYYEACKSSDPKKYAGVHKEMIVKIQYLSQTKRFMTCCRAGTVCFWSDRLKLQKKFVNAGLDDSYIGKFILKMVNEEAKMEPVLKAPIIDGLMMLILSKVFKSWFSLQMIIKFHFMVSQW
jgi:hypothetical protein